MILLACFPNLFPFARVFQILFIMSLAMSSYAIGKIDGENTRNRDTENAEQAIN